MTLAVVHSMRGDLAPADWPRLDPEEVQTVVEHWGLTDTQVHVVWHSPRPLSAAGLVELSDRKLFLKRHHRSVRTPQELREEHRFIQHLRGHGAPVSAIVEAANGDTALNIGDWTYEIHSAGIGTDLYRHAVSWSPFMNVDHARAAGRALGLLHVSAQGFDAPHRRASVLVSNDRIIRSREPLRAIDRLCAERPALREYLDGKHWRADIARAIAPFHDRYQDALAALEPLWTHNDWHASNLLWSDADGATAVLTVLDFGLSDQTSAIYDLATAIERNTIPWLDIHEGAAGAADLTQVSALLHGYLGARLLSSGERAALIALLPLVHVGYALTEIDYFHGITRSTDNADLAYQGFLLGHCAWFESGPGRALLEHVRRELCLDR